MNEIIYSLRVMEQLVKRGYLPNAVMPNPKNPKYNCWVFAQSEEFQRDLSEILKGVSRND